MKTFIALLLLPCVVAAKAQPRLPTNEEIAAFKRLASQSVLHVEAALKKIEKAGPDGSPEKMRREVSAPATELLKEWRASQLSDAVMMSYSSCQNMLGDIQVYSVDALNPPKYHLSQPAQQKLRYIKQDLLECRTLRTHTPDFNFARSR